MCTHDLCLEQKIRKISQFSSENHFFYNSEKLLYIKWACFRNDSVSLLFNYLDSIMALVSISEISDL